jgi:hypothetical protein
MIKTWTSQSVIKSRFSRKEGSTPIRPFLADEPFDPEIIAKMSAALESACEALGLKLVDDPATRLVAEKIIELVQRGVRDAGTLSTMTLKELPQESGMF